MTSAHLMSNLMVERRWCVILRGIVGESEQLDEDERAAGAGEGKGRKRVGLNRGYRETRNKGILLWRNLRHGALCTREENAARRVRIGSGIASHIGTDHCALLCDRSMMIRSPRSPCPRHSRTKSTYHRFRRARRSSTAHGRCTCWSARFWANTAWADKDIVQSVRDTLNNTSVSALEQLLA